MRSVCDFELYDPRHLYEIRQASVLTMCFLHSVYILYGGRHWPHSVPDTVWEDRSEYLLRAPSPSQLVHVQYEWSGDHL